jgi:hypothetical protein
MKSRCTGVQGKMKKGVRKAGGRSISNAFAICNFKLKDDASPSLHGSAAGLGRPSRSGQTSLLFTAAEDLLQFRNEPIPPSYELGPLVLSRQLHHISEYFARIDNGCEQVVKY